MDNMNGYYAFLEGYRLGEAGESDMTPREVSQKYPTFANYQIGAFLSGLEDGRQGDTFRRDRVLEVLDDPGVGLL